MDDVLSTNIRGRHAAPDNQIIVRNDAGKITGAINNLDTRVTPETTEVRFSSACGGKVCLRMDDNKHSDFWMEFNLDIPTLERLLAAAKESTALYNLLFPQLEGDKWAKVNLNALALQFDQSDTPSTAEEDDHWVNLLHEKLRVDHSWGGYMEHRSHLLRHHYMKDVEHEGHKDHFWHLGIDYNVPAGTEVHLPVDAELVYAATDGDQNGGWGGKLIFKMDKGYLILGHLHNFATQLGPYKKGDVVAEVGDTDVNGGWFPHLHVQCCREFKTDVDGYSHWYPGIKRDFPDPTVLFGSVDNIDKANEITEKVLIYLNGPLGDALESISPEGYDTIEDEIAEIINANL